MYLKRENDRPLFNEDREHDARGDTDRKEASSDASEWEDPAEQAAFFTCGC